MKKEEGKRSPARPGMGQVGILGFFVHSHASSPEGQDGHRAPKDTVAVTMGSPSLLPPVLTQPEKAKEWELAWCLLPGDQLQVPSK